MDIYANFRTACALKGTTLTRVLADLHHSTGMTGSWSKGGSPRLDVCIEIADYLGIGLDELVFGVSREAAKLNADQTELLGIYSAVPADKHDMCKAFLRTHIAEDLATLRKNA